MSSTSVVLPHPGLPYTINPNFLSASASFSSIMSSSPWLISRTSPHSLVRLFLEATSYRTSFFALISSFASPAASSFCAAIFALLIMKLNSHPAAVIMKPPARALISLSQMRRSQPPGMKRNLRRSGAFSGGAGTTVRSIRNRLRELLPVSPSPSSAAVPFGLRTCPLVLPLPFPFPFFLLF